MATRELPWRVQLATWTEPEVTRTTASRTIYRRIRVILTTETMMPSLLRLREGMIRVEDTLAAGTMMVAERNIMIAEGGVREMVISERAFLGWRRCSLEQHWVRSRVDAGTESICKMTVAGYYVRLG